MPIQVSIADEQDDWPVDRDRLSTLARRVLEELGAPQGTEVSVSFVDEATVAGLNDRYLGRDGPTDVLSFPIEDEVTLAGVDPAGPPLLLGDVVICPEVAHRNAPGHAGTYDDELSLLLVHGILHLVGMDHEVEAEAEEMEALEARLLARHAEPSKAPPRR